jgi:hypothetical protein
VSIAAIASKRTEISALQKNRPRSDLENRRLAALKSQLNYWVSREELFSKAITLLLKNESIQRLKTNVLFDDKALSDLILGLRDRVFTGSVSGEHSWRLRNGAYASEVILPVTEAESRRMHQGMFLHDSKMRTLGQIEEEEAHFPLGWLDSDILFAKAVPAILVPVLESFRKDMQTVSEQRILDFSRWQVHLRP